MLVEMNILKKLVCPVKNFSSINRILSTSAELKKETESKLVTLVNRERSLNSVTLIGRVGTDPTIIRPNAAKNRQNEDNLAKETNTTQLSVFSLATSEYSGLDSDGKPKFRVDWHRIVVVAERAQTLVEKYIKKGDRIHVTGRLHYNMTKDRNGETKYVTNIVADDFIFLNKNLDSSI